MKQRSAIRLQEFLPYRLSVASNAVSSLIARAYEDRFQLTIPEWRLIAILAERGESTPLDLGRTARMDKITVSRAAKALLKRALISARPNAADRRSHFLALTEEGRGLYRRVAPIALELEDDLLRHFTQAEVTQLSEMLRRLEAAALGE